MLQIELSGAAVSLHLSHWGEVDARSASGEGLRPIESPRSPHPNPLPKGPNGERECAAFSAATSTQVNHAQAPLAEAEGQELVEGALLDQQAVQIIVVALT